MQTDRTAIAVRQRMHGPLWTVERGRRKVSLWGPTARREGWALGWTILDEDDEVIDQGHLHADSFVEFPALVPRHIAKLVGAALNAASAWDSSERCDHTRATSAGVLDDGRYECGYCGRPFDGPFPVPR